LFNLARFKGEALVRNMLFADDAAVAIHIQQNIRSLIDRLFQTCKNFGLPTSLKKTNVLVQNTD